jgi:hypothetical protein
MVTLTNPVASQNIVDRFADYVTYTANTGIVWGTNSLPTFEGTTVVDSTYFGGTTSGRPIGITGNTIGASGSNIIALNIFNTLLNETNAYTSIRNLRAILFVEGAGGNTGTRPNPGTIFDQTSVSYLSSTYLQSIDNTNLQQPTAGSNITTSGLETFFTNLTTQYQASRASAVTVQTNVCHASCHSSCHGSRSRR